MPKQNSIDIICNSETSDSWVIADFNGEINDPLSFNLFKALTAYSSLHVLNTKLCDFDAKSGKPSDEIQQILDWYIKYPQGKISLVVLVRDLKQRSNQELVGLIRETLCRGYSGTVLITLDNLFDGNTDSEVLNSRRWEFKEKFNLEVMDKLSKWSMHSIFDIKTFYERLAQNPNHANFSYKDTHVKKKFNRLFNFNNQNKFEGLKTIFELSNINKEIERLELKIAQYSSSHDSSEDKQMRTKFDSNEEKKTWPSTL
jgi:hypothetical protein